MQGVYPTAEVTMAPTRKAELPRVVARQFGSLYLVETGEPVPRLAADVVTGRLYERQQRKLSEPLAIARPVKFGDWDIAVDAETCVEVAAEVAALLDDGEAWFTPHPLADDGPIPREHWLPMIPSDW